MALCHLFVSVMVANILFILQSAKYSGDIFVPCLLIVRAGRGNILLTNNLYWYCSLSSRGQMTGLPDFRTSGLPDFLTSGLPDFRTSGLPDFRTSGLLDFWTSGLPDFRTSGLPDFLTSGLLDFRTSNYSSFFSSKCMLSMNRLMTSGLPVCLPSSSEILHVSL